MRVLLVAGVLVARHMAIWKQVCRQGVDLQIEGALRHLPSAGPWWRPEEPDFCPVHSVRPLSMPRRGQNWWYYPGLRERIASLRPDVVHVAAEPWAVRVSQALASGVPVVVHSADNMFLHGHRWAAVIRRRRLREMLPQLAGFASWNSAGLGLARSHGLPAGVPTLVAPAELPDPAEFVISAAARSTAREGLGLAPGEIGLGFFGRLEQEKGPLLLIRSFLEADLAGARLFIFGGGSLAGAVEEQAARAGGRICVMGPVPLERVPELVASMDIAVVPSITTPVVAEQFSRAAVEAMMASTPLIVANCGALPEVVGSAALVVEEGSEAALTAAITHLATDDRARRELAEKGLARARTAYAPEVIAGGLVRLWSEAVSSR